MRLVIWGSIDDLEAMKSIRKALLKDDCTDDIRICAGPFEADYNRTYFRKADIILIYFPDNGPGLHRFVSCHRGYTQKTLLLLGYPLCCDVDPRIYRYDRLFPEDYILMRKHWIVFEKESLDRLTLALLDRSRTLC